MVMRGKINWFHKQRNYGFITGEDGKDVFFHTSEYHGPLEEIKDGIAVEFERKTNRDGSLRAVQVKKI